MSSYITHLHALAPSPLIFPYFLCFIPSFVSSIPWFPQLDTRSSLESPLTVLSIKNAGICSYWDWLSSATCNPPPNTLGKEGEGKGRISLCVCTSVISACSFSDWNLPNVAGSEQSTELCGTSTAGQPWCPTPAACGVPKA